MVAPQIRTRTKHTAIKHFFTNGDVKMNMLTPRNISQIFLQDHYILSCLDIYAKSLTVGG